MTCAGHIRFAKIRNVSALAGDQTYEATPIGEQDEHLYKALVELDATLWLHPSRPPINSDYTDEKLSQYYEWLLVGWPNDTASVMFRSVFSGVFNRYPTIRIVTHHHGAFIPLLAPRLDNGWLLFEPVGLPMPTKISKPYIDHFRNFYCDTAASGLAPKALELAVDFFGPERFCSDRTRRLIATTVKYFSRKHFFRSTRWLFARNAHRHTLEERHADFETELIQLFAV